MLFGRQGCSGHLTSNRPLRRPAPGGLRAPGNRLQQTLQRLRGFPGHSPHSRELASPFLKGTLRWLPRQMQTAHPPPPESHQDGAPEVSPHTAHAGLSSQLGSSSTGRAEAEGGTLWASSGPPREVAGGRKAHPAPAIAGRATLRADASQSRRDSFGS